MLDDAPYTKELFERPGAYVAVRSTTWHGFHIDVGCRPVKAFARVTRMSISLFPASLITRLHPHQSIFVRLP